jgi:hypothetical protein
MDKYGFGSKQKEAPKSTTRAVAGKSYGADYDDPEGNDDADDKKPEAGPKKSVKKGVFKRRYNTKAYTKESFTGLLNDYMDGGVKSLLESLEIVEVEEVEQMDEDEMTQRKKEQVVTVKHKDSGKELRVVKAAVADYQKRGYHPVKEEVEQMDEAPLRAVSALVGYPKLNRKIASKGTPGSEDERNKAAAGLRKDRSGLGRRAYTGDQHYDVRREEVEQMDEAPMKRNLSGFKERYDKGE